MARLVDSQKSAAADAFFDNASPLLIAPAIFAFEIRNALVRAERRGITKSNIVDQAFLELSDLVVCRPWSDRAADFARQIALARKENLLLFDAAYLDLAIEEGAPLASRDASLLAAAQNRGVPVHDLR